jgi:hypothetical protein
MVGGCRFSKGNTTTNNPLNVAFFPPFRVKDRVMYSLLLTPGSKVNTPTLLTSLVNALTVVSMLLLHMVHRFGSVLCSRDEIRSKRMPHLTIVIDLA